MRIWKQVLVACAMLASLAGAARADRIVYSANGDIWSVNVDGSQRYQVTSHPDTEWTPNLSSDGGKIVFWWHSTDAAGGYVEGMDTINPDGSGRTALIPPGRHSLGIPDWSPNDREIAFQGDSPGSGTYGILLMNGDGSNVRQIPNTLGGRSPLWSGDGQSIAFFDQSANVLRVVDRDGTVLQRIPLGEQESGFGFAWSADGKSFYVRGNRGGVTRISAEDGAREALIPPGSLDLALSPSGDMLLYTIFTTQYEIRVLDLNTRQDTLIAANVTFTQPHWSAAPAIPSPAPTPTAVPTATPFPTQAPPPTPAPSPTAEPMPAPNQPPLVRIAAPANGSIARSVNEIRGLLLDDTFGERPALKVTLRLRSGPYWNGRAFQTLPFALATAQVPLPTSPYGSLWRCTTKLPTSAQLREGLYLAEAVATDKEGLTSRSTAGVRIDLTPPQLALTSVSFNNARSSLAGTWRDAGNIQSIFIQIRRGDGTFWNGLRWQTSPVLLPTDLSGTNATRTSGIFSLGIGLPLQRDLPAGSLLSILAIDRAGNRAGVQQRIGPPPSVPRA